MAANSACSGEWITVTLVLIPSADSRFTAISPSRMIGTLTTTFSAIFSESTVSANPARQVAQETGARYGGVLYVDSLSDAKGPVPCYLRLLEYDVETIVRGLLGE